MIPRTTHNSCPFGLALFAVLLAAYKAASLTIEMGVDWYRFVVLMGLDAWFLALILILTQSMAYIQPKWIRAIVWLILAFLTFYYLVDSFVLLALDEHTSLFEISRYTPEWGVVLSFFDSTAYMAILLFLISLFLFLRPVAAAKRLGFVIIAFTLFLAVLSMVSAPRALRVYAMPGPQDVLQEMAPRQATDSYSEKEMAFYAGLKKDTVTIPESKPDIILLIIESLSSINSRRISGGHDVLGSFDELTEEGVLFRNFFANHQASEGGLIALLGGFPPMHFPTATPYMFDEFAVQPSVINEYRQQGYFTEFLTNADLAFIGLDHFLTGLGLDRSRGRDEVDSMRLAPRVVQDAPSDAYLYHEAMLTVRSLMSSPQPFLLTIATTSTHLPYTHPEGGPNTPAAVWEWGLQQLLVFHSRLSESGFFDNGILLITGDHRQMRPVSDDEIERYGGSARARVPLLALGESFAHGRIDDRFFQQSDLLRMLGKIDNEEASLSPHPIWVERYNRKYGRIELINNLSVFDEADQGRHEYRLKVPGNRIEWLDKKPVFARQVESRIHKQRSVHQQARESLNRQSVKDL